MQTKRRYTDEEDRVIISEIIESPGNLQRAFRKAGSQIGRSSDAICVHWHRSLKLRTDCIFMTVSGKQCTVNGKNVVILSNTRVKNSNNNIWGKIKRLFHL